MKYLKQFGIILTISFAGELMKHWIPLPIPASIYGIAILFLGLQTGLIRLSSIRETGSFLVQIMPIMFVPTAVGLMNSWGVIRDAYMEYLIMIVLSTAAVMVVSGKVSQFFVDKQEEKNGEGEASHG